MAVLRLLGASYIIERCQNNQLILYPATTRPIRAGSNQKTTLLGQRGSKIQIEHSDGFARRNQGRADEIMIQEKGSYDPRHISQDIKDDDMAQAEEAEGQGMASFPELVFP